MREGGRVRGGRGIDGVWVVSAMIKDQQGLMKDRVREGERYSEKESERIYNGRDDLLWQPRRKLGEPIFMKGWGNKQVTGSAQWGV